MSCALVQPVERALPDALAGFCRRGEPLAPHTHCKIGGVARVFCEARSEEEVRVAAAWRREAALADDDVLVLGGGANVLINDARDYGLVLTLSEHFARIEVDARGGTARIEAGIRTPRLVREAAARGWQGFQFLAGVPGTLGGAVAMNAGVKELSTWDVVRAAEGIAWDGGKRVVTREEAQPRYRHGGLPPGLVVTAAICEIRPGDPGEIHRQARRLSTSRRDTQPLTHPSWGSTFRNPSGSSSTGTTAGALIERAGLKGYRVGDAQISELHANFVVNLGAATAADALACIRKAYEEVRDRFGVRLVPEVRLVGFPSRDLAFLEGEAA
jgi:UDP-N-acetylmuramate dehydrogenase